MRQRALLTPVKNIPIIEIYLYSIYGGKTMKKILILVSIIMLAAVLVLPVYAGGGKESAVSGKVVLTMGSWRADDVVQVNKLLAEYSRLNPNVEIRFQPTNPPDYNATLRLQLDSGTGPDLMYARS
jgi:raffinose/stachyose/melibiose transport system substrate-binding protein